MCYRVGLKAMRATTTTALVDTECLKTQPGPDEMVAVPELAGMVERKIACAGEKNSGLGDIGRKGWLAFVLLVGAMGAQAHAQSVDGRVERGTRTYYCDVWNSASIRAHVLFVEYFYKQGGQWYNVSRRCTRDPRSCIARSIWEAAAGSIRASSGPISHQRLSRTFRTGSLVVFRQPA